MLNWQTELANIFVNADWNDTPSVHMVSNDPEVGNPIRRLRSYNVKHTISCSVTLTYTEFTTFRNFVLRKLHGGIDPFIFRSFIDDHEYPTTFVMENGTPFTSKRDGMYNYSVSFTLSYIELGGAADA